MDYGLKISIHLLVALFGLILSHILANNGTAIDQYVFNKPGETKKIRCNCTTDSGGGGVSWQGNGSACGKANGKHFSFYINPTNGQQVNLTVPTETKCCQDIPTIGTYTASTSICSE